MIRRFLVLAAWVLALPALQSHAQEATVLSGDQSDALSATAGGVAEQINEIAPDLTLKSSQVRKYVPAFSERSSLKAAQDAKADVKVAEKEVIAAKKAAKGAKP